MRASRRLIVPLLLVAIGVALLIGCIPIPLPRTSQSDGLPRPEQFVGDESRYPVWIGHTKIAEAFITLSRRVRSQTTNPMPLPMALATMAPEWSITYWSVSPDGRRFALRYTIYTTFWVAPLCFVAWHDHETRWLVLDVSPNGIVTGYRVVSKGPENWQTTPGRWLEVFDEATRKKLYDAGVFPSDELLNYVEQQRQQMLRKSQELRERHRRAATTRSEYSKPRGG